MSNTVLTASIIAKEATMILENELLMAGLVHRGHEKEFTNSVNGYEVGATVTIKKPTDFTVRSGATAVSQDVIEGSTSITVDKQKGVDFNFSSLDLTMSIKDISERVIKPAMVQLANQVDVDLMGLYKYVPGWVGTPGQTVNSFADYAVAPQRLDTLAVPKDQRSSVLSPADYWGLLGSQTALYMTGPATGAYRDGSLGKIGGVDTNMSQNIPTHLTGSDLSGTVNQSIVTTTITYSAVKTTMQQTVTVASVTMVPGDVFTIANVNSVNPVTKADTGIAKQFVCISYSANTLVMYPAMIWTGAQQNVAVASGTTDLNSAAITGVGTASTSYAQNLMFHKNAFALAMVPMVKPPGAVDVARETMNGISVRIIPYYDGTNDISNWRADILYGVKAIDPRLATRFSGT